MNEIAARILKYYQNQRMRNEAKEEPITINNYVFPNTNGEGIKEYQGIVVYKHKHTKVKHRYKITYAP